MSAPTIRQLAQAIAESGDLHSAGLAERILAQLDAAERLTVDVPLPRPKLRGGGVASRVYARRSGPDVRIADPLPDSTDTES